MVYTAHGPATTPPFRADHVGSLLRPPELLRARGPRRRRDGETLRAVEDEAIRAAVRMQEEIGLQAATDGEFRRASWHMDFIYQLGGVTRIPRSRSPSTSTATRATSTPSSPGCTSTASSASATIFGDDFAFLRDAVTTAVPKLTIPSPSMVHYRGGRASIDPSIYPDLDSFWADLTAAYREEVRRLGELGCTYLQLDDTSLAYLNDPAQREYVARSAATRTASTSSTSATSTRRSPAGPRNGGDHPPVPRQLQVVWVAEGGYDFVAEALFNELEVDGFFLE